MFEIEAENESKPSPLPQPSRALDVFFLSLNSILATLGRCFLQRVFSKLKSHPVQRQENGVKLFS